MSILKYAPAHPGLWKNRSHSEMLLISITGDTRQLSQCPDGINMNWDNMAKSKFCYIFLREIEKKLNRQIYSTLTIGANKIHPTLKIFMDGVSPAVFGATRVCFSLSQTEFVAIRVTADAFLQCLLSAGAIPLGFFELMGIKELFEPIVLASLPWFEHVFEILETDEYKVLKESTDVYEPFGDEIIQLAIKLKIYMKTWSDWYWTDKTVLRIPESTKNLYALMKYNDHKKKNELVLATIPLNDIEFDRIYASSGRNVAGEFCYPLDHLPEFCPQYRWKDVAGDIGFFLTPPLVHFFSSSAHGKHYNSLIVEYLRILNEKERNERERKESESQVAEAASCSKGSDGVQLDPESIVSRVRTFIDKVVDTMGWKIHRFVRKIQDSFTIYTWLSRTPYACLGGKATSHNESFANDSSLLALFERMGDLEIVPETVRLLIQLDDAWNTVFLDAGVRILKQLTLAQDLPSIKISVRKIVSDETMSMKPVEESNITTKKMVAGFETEVMRLSKLFWPRQTIVAPKTALFPPNLLPIPKIKRHPDDITRAAEEDVKNRIERTSKELQETMRRDMQSKKVADRFDANRDHSGVSRRSRSRSRSRSPIDPHRSSSSRNTLPSNSTPTSVSSNSYLNYMPNLQQAPPTLPYGWKPSSTSKWDANKLKDDEKWKW